MPIPGVTGDGVQGAGNLIPCHRRSALTPDLARDIRQQLRQLRDRLRPVQGKLVNRPWPGG